MVVYLSDGEGGGERHFVGKAETETGEGDAPFPRLGVATVHLVVAPMLPLLPGNWLQPKKKVG